MLLFYEQIHAYRKLLLKIIEKVLEEVGLLQLNNKSENLMKINIKLNLCACLFILLFVGKASYAEVPVNTSHDTRKDDISVIEEQEKEQRHAMKSASLINLYRPNYILPFYYTGTPYQDIYFGQTPNNQKIRREEFKAQLSFIIPLYRTHLFSKPLSLSTAYTQLMYWQFYSDSEYFRETNYEPEVFIQGQINDSTAWQIGLNHESNGRGGALERSWNRLYGEYALSGDNWLVKMRAWVLIAQANSSDINNPDIATFLGYDNLVLSYNWNSLTASLKIQNLERITNKGFLEASLSYPMLHKISIYGQFFHGYGQSLIEYNHKTTSFGVGIVLNDWVND